MPLVLFTRYVKDYKPSSRHYYVHDAKILTVLEILVEFGKV